MKGVAWVGILGVLRASWHTPLGGLWGVQVVSAHGDQTISVTNELCYLRGVATPLQASLSSAVKWVTMELKELMHREHFTRTSHVSPLQPCRGQ